MDTVSTPEAVKWTPLHRCALSALPRSEFSLTYHFVLQKITKIFVKKAFLLFQTYTYFPRHLPGQLNSPTYGHARFKVYWTWNVQGSALCSFVHVLGRSHWQTESRRKCTASRSGRGNVCP